MKIRLKALIIFLLIMCFLYTLEKLWILTLLINRVKVVLFEQNSTILILEIIVVWLIGVLSIVALALVMEDKNG